MVLSPISVHGPPQFVLHFSRLLLLLCRRSSQRRAAERRACLMSAPPSWFGPRAVPPFLISLPKQWNICCQLLHVSVCHVLPRPPPTDTTPSGSTPPHPKPPQSTVYGIYTYDPCRDRGHRSGKRKCSSSLRLCCHHSGRFLTKPYICLQVYLFYLAIKCESSSSPVVVKPFDWLGHSGL